MRENPGAFPSPRAGLDNDGMTLRDYFAAAVAPAVYADLRKGESMRMAAEEVFAFADALLEERKNKKKDDL